MPVIVDVVDAKAVVALTAGAVAELQTGEVGVSSAADLALAGIGLRFLLILDAAHLVFEVDRFGTLFPAGGFEIIKEPAAAEKQVIEQCDDG